MNDKEIAIKKAIEELKEANVWDAHIINAQHILEDALKHNKETS